MLFRRKQTNLIHNTAFYGRTLAIEPARLDPILQSRIPVESFDFSSAMAKRQKYSIVDGVAVLEISGPLVSGELGFIERLFGMQSYDHIQDDFKTALADPDVEKILFAVNSPGGEAGGMFDLADDVYSARGSKPIWAIADDSAFSAAYGIASAADRLYVTRTGGVGSVGVIAVHMERSERDRQEGYTYTVIRGGEYKAEGNPIEPLTEHAKNSIQSEVDRIYSMFVDMVSRNRSASASSIAGTKAQVYYGEKAVQIGLADGVASLRNVLAEFSNKKIDPKAIAAQNETPAEDLAVLSGESLKAAVAQAVDESRKEAIQILELCDLAQRPQWALALINKGLSLEQARTRIIDDLAIESDSYEINNVLTPQAMYGKSQSQGINAYEIFEERKQRSSGR